MTQIFHLLFQLRNESNGIFALGVMFFFRQISIFYLGVFDKFFNVIQKNIVAVSLNKKRYFTLIGFLIGAKSITLYFVCCVGG